MNLDDLEHLRRGGLLLQRSFYLIEQPRVLDGDYSLGCEVQNQLNLLASERAHLRAIEGYSACVEPE